MDWTRIYTAIGWLAMLTMPAAAAANFGLAAYETFLPRAGVGFAVAVGASTAVGLEAIGILLGHTAVQFHARSDRRWVLSVAGMALYAAVGTIELYRVPFSRFVPLLAVLAYVAVALQADAETAVTDERAAAAADADHRRDMQRMRAQMKHEQELARINATHASHHAPDAHTPAPHAPHVNGSAAHYECACGAVLDSPQAYAAHKRWQHGGDA